MISPERMIELISDKKEIYVLFWFCLAKKLRVHIVSLTDEFRVDKKNLYFRNSKVYDLDMCFEDLDLKYQRLNGLVEDCDFMYSYKSIEDDLM